MLEMIENIEIDPRNWEFVSLVHSERIYESGFVVNDKLLISFDNKSGGKVALSAIKPEISAPHYHIRPIDMGAAQWYSIECDISKESLDQVGQLVPCLDAASAQSVSLFALLRIFYEDGRSEDISSLQVELRRSRTQQAFPISLGDIPSLSHAQIAAARLIFFIEARNVAIDIYGLTIASVLGAKASYDDDSIARLRAAHDAGSPSLQMRRLSAQDDNLWTGEALEHRSIVPNVFLDFEPGSGRQMTVSRNGDSLDIDFTRTSDGGWRNLEFRFEGVANSGSVSALLYAKGAAGQHGRIEATLILREYDEKFVWEDTHIPVSLPLYSDKESELRLIDLSPLLSDKRDVHRFGIMLFLPPQAELLNVAEMDVFVFDRELV